ncbi:MAG TPA: PAS domain S-box protein [Leptolyngbyaceae cyanobacterium]
MQDLETLLIREVITVAPTTSLEETVTLMTARLKIAPNEAEASCVCVESGVVTGVITQADIVSLIATQPEWRSLRVSDVLRQEPYLLQVETAESLADLGRRFCRQHVSVFPVVDRVQRLVGLLTQERLLQALIQTEPIPSASGASSAKELPPGPIEETLAAHTVQLKQNPASETLLETITTHLHVPWQQKVALGQVVIELHQFFQSDRVLIYQFRPDWSGRVVAEAVSPGWNTLLGQEITDAYFIEHCLESYQQGRIQVTNDVMASSLSPCCIDLLGSFQVQAIVAAPILQDDCFWGLLLLQECAGPRSWQPFEIGLLQWVSNQIAIALQQSAHSQKICQEVQADQEEAAQSLWQSQATELLASLAQKALQVTDLALLLDEVAHHVAQALDVQFCGILELLPNRAALLLKAGVGWPRSWIRQATMRADQRSQYGYTLLHNQPVAVADLRLETRFSDTPFLHNLSIVSGVSTLVQGKDGPYGVLSVHVRHQRDFSATEIGLLQSVADILAAVVKRHQTEEELVHFFELSLDLFCIVSPEGLIQQANARFETLLGYPVASLVGTSLINLTHPEDRDFTQEALSRLNPGASTIHFENRCCGNGVCHWIAWSITLTGLGEKLFGVGRDITQEKQTALAMLEQQRQLSAITHNVPVGVYRLVCHTDGRISVPFASEAYQALVGIPPSHLMAHPSALLALVHPEDRDRRQSAIDQAWQSRRSQGSIEYRLQLPSGEVKWVSDRTHFTWNEAGDLVIDGVHMDISDRKQTEVQLRVQAAVLDRVRNAVLAYDLEGNITYWNPYAADLYQLNRDNQGQSILHLYQAEDVALAEQSLQTVLQTGIWEGELTIQRDDSSTLSVYLVKTLIRDEHEQPVHIVSIGIDVTAQRQSEQALRESQRQYVTLAEAAPVGIFRSDLEGNAIYLNNRWCQMARLPAAEALRRRWYQVLHPADWSAMEATWRQTVQSQQPFYGEYCFQRPGGIMWVYVQAIPERDEAGNLISYLGTITDISDRKQIEIALQALNQNLEDIVQLRTEELRQSNEQLRREIAERELAEAAWQDSQRFLELVLDSIPQAVFWKDCNGLYQGCNRNFARDAGLASNEDIVGKCDRDLPWWNSEAAHSRQREQHILNTGIPELHLVEIQRQSDGQTRWLETSKVPLHNSNGQLIGILGSYEDITARRQAEEALRESQRFVQSIADTSPSILYIYDVQEKSTVYINRELKGTLGYAPEVFQQANQDVVTHLLHPDDVATVMVHRQQLNTAQDGEILEMEYRMHHANGEWRWFRARDAVFSRDAQHQVKQIIGVALDISDRKRAEVEILRTLEREKELNALKSRFISMASHELRTPLTTILGSTELLQYSSHRWPEEKKQRHFEQIKHTVYHMTSLVDDVLLYSKAEADRLSCNPAPLDLVTFCHDIIEELTMSESFPHRILLETSQLKDKVLLDAHLLRQILVNLLSNSLKYSELTSSVYLRINRQSNQVTLEVQDKGIGIPAQDLPHLYESFHRGANVGSIPGTGLGLPIVKRAVDIHQGQLKVESEESKGTLVTVILPCR